MKYLPVILGLTIILRSQTTPVATTVEPADKPLPIAVLNLEGRGVSAQEADILTERLRSLLVQEGRYQLVERSRMEAILQEQGFQQSACATSECLIQAGQILGVQRMVSGTVGRIGGSYTVDVRLFDVESTQILKAVSRNYSGPVDGLLEALGRAFDTVGQALDTTARSVANLLKPRPKDPDIRRGREQGELDAQDYHNRFVWMVPTLTAAGGMLYNYRDEAIEDQLAAGIVAGFIAKLVFSAIAGDPRLPVRRGHRLHRASL
ncbi:MAG: CsgG/HfaB family protein [Candidatus Neomarinimicrobiota bacterium]